MRYEYNGTIVESGKELGSILFKPVTEKAAEPTKEAAPRKTAKKTTKKAE